VVTIGLTLVEGASKSKRKSWSLELPPWLTGQPLTLTWPKVFSQATDHGITRQIPGFVLIRRRHLKSVAILWTQSMSREPTSFGHVQSGKASSFESKVPPTTPILYPHSLGLHWRVSSPSWRVGRVVSSIPVVLSPGHVSNHLGTFPNCIPPHAIPGDIGAWS